MSVPSDETRAFSRPGANVPTYVFSSPINNAAYSFGTASPVEAHLVRSFTVPRAAVFALTGTVTPRLGSALDAIAPAVRRAGLAVRAPLRAGTADRHQRGDDSDPSVWNRRGPALGVPAPVDGVPHSAPVRRSSPAHGRRRPGPVPVHDPDRARRSAPSAHHRPESLGQRQRLQWGHPGDINRSGLRLLRGVGEQLQPGVGCHSGREPAPPSPYRWLATGLGGPGGTRGHDHGHLQSRSHLPDHPARGASSPGRTLRACRRAVPVSPLVGPDRRGWMPPGAVLVAGALVVLVLLEDPWRWPCFLP